jgi:hypothetical protein
MNLPCRIPSLLLDNSLDAPLSASLEYTYSVRRLDERLIVSNSSAPHPATQQSNTFHHGDQQTFFVERASDFFSHRLNLFSEVSQHVVHGALRVLPETPCH